MMQESIQHNFDTEDQKQYGQMQIRNEISMWQA